MKTTPTGRRLLAIATAGALLVASCSGGASEEAATTLQPTVPATAQETTTTSSSAGPTLICEDPPPLEITLGTPFDGELLGVTQCFSVQVASGAASLTIELTGMAGMLSLGVAYPDVAALQTPGSGDYWNNFAPGTDDELIVIEDPAAGTYFINVGPATVRDESQFTLVAATQ